jgi:hypothetical protein
VGTNVVTKVVEQLGGVVQAAAVARVAPETIYRSMQKGKVVNPAAVIRLVRAVVPGDVATQMALAARLAGLLD